MPEAVGWAVACTKGKQIWSIDCSDIYHQVFYYLISFLALRVYNLYITEVFVPLCNILGLFWSFTCVKAVTCFKTSPTISLYVEGKSPNHWYIDSYLPYTKFKTADYLILTIVNIKFGNISIKNSVYVNKTCSFINVQQDSLITLQYIPWEISKGCRSLRES